MWVCLQRMRKTIYKIIDVTRQSNEDRKSNDERFGAQIKQISPQEETT